MSDSGEIKITDDLVRYIQDNLSDEGMYMAYEPIRCVLRHVNQYYVDLGEEAGRQPEQR